MTDPASSVEPVPEKSRASGLLRFLPILLIAAAAAIFFASGAGKYLRFEALQENYKTLEGFVEANFLGALALYMLAYVAVAALSLPGATLMSMLGGFLFGILVGTGAVVVSATIGASIIFLAARTAFRDFFRKRAGGFIKKMEAGFSENAFSYLLLLRLIPVFPFFIVNIAPAFTQISIRTFIAATFIGIIPGAFAFVSAGNGLGAVLAQGGDLQLSGLLTQPEVLTPIIALSLLAVLPIAFRHFRNQRQNKERA